MLNFITTELLDSISAQAKESPRLRMNFNFHEALEAPSQRLLNALEPGTVMPVHRHRHTQETYVLLRGRLLVQVFDGGGKLLDERELEPLKGMYGVNIPKGVWHSLTVLDPGTVILECKDGPYVPIKEEDILR
jgi:cupin fold WbuC family metalloprotein